MKMVLKLHFVVSSILASLAHFRGVLRVFLPVISKNKAEMKARCNACSLAGFINKCHHLFVSI